MNAQAAGKPPRYAVSLGREFAQAAKSNCALKVAESCSSLLQQLTSPAAPQQHCRGFLVRPQLDADGVVQAVLMAFPRKAVTVAKDADFQGVTSQLRPSGHDVLVHASRQVAARLESTEGELPWFLEAVHETADQAAGQTDWSPQGLRGLGRIGARDAVVAFFNKRSAARARGEQTPVVPFDGLFQLLGGRFSTATLDEIDEIFCAMLAHYMPPVDVGADGKTVDALRLVVTHVVGEGGDGARQLLNWITSSVAYQRVGPAFSEAFGTDESYASISSFQTKQQSDARLQAAIEAARRLAARIEEAERVAERDALLTRLDAQRARKQAEEARASKDAGASALVALAHAKDEAAKAAEAFRTAVDDASRAAASRAVQAANVRAHARLMDVHADRAEAAVEAAVIARDRVELYRLAATTERAIADAADRLAQAVESGDFQRADDEAEKLAVCESTRAPFVHAAILFSRSSFAEMFRGSVRAEAARRRAHYQIVELAAKDRAATVEALAAKEDDPTVAQSLTEKCVALRAVAEAASAVAAAAVAEGETTARAAAENDAHARFVEAAAAASWSPLALPVLPARLPATSPPTRLPTRLPLYSGAAARDLDTGKVCRVVSRVWGGGAWNVRFPGDDELVERPADKLEAIEDPEIRRLSVSPAALEEIVSNAERDANDRGFTAAKLVKAPQLAAVHRAIARASSRVVEAARNVQAAARGRGAGGRLLETDPVRTELVSAVAARDRVDQQLGEVDSLLSEAGRSLVTCAKARLASTRAVPGTRFHALSSAAATCEAAHASAATAYAGALVDHAAAGTEDVEGLADLEKRVEVTCREADDALRLAKEAYDALQPPAPTTSAPVAPRVEIKIHGLQIEG